MLSPEDLLFYQGVFKDIDTNDLYKLLQLAKTRTLQPGEVYIPEGAFYPKLAFIKKGLVRVHRLKDEEMDITFMLRWENQFIASMENILQQKPSKWTYEAMEETQLIELDYLEAKPVIDASISLSAARSAFLLQMLSAAMERVELFVLLSPEERYRKMLAENPQVINRVPDKHLATLMGITPVSLSRIRRRIAEGS